LGVAFSKDPGGKTMQKRTLTQRTGQARGNLMRQERELRQAKGNLESATRNRIVGGVILVIGVIALIQFNVVVGGVVLLVGGWLFIGALGQISKERHSIGTLTARVTNARAKLADLKAQPAVAD
jgi:Flp pilus assembly protein TadB